MSMGLGLLLQYLVIALAVVASAGFVVSHRFPRGARRVRIVAAVPLVREGRARWMQRLGRWLAPVPAAGSDATCGRCTGCSKA